MRNAEKDAAEKVGGRALNRAKEALMNKMTKLFMLAAVAAATPLWAVEVSNVKARQRWPWNGLVDITCTVSGINGTDHGLDFAVEEVMDSGIYNATHFWTVRDGKKSDARNVETNGNYRLLWDAGADLGPELYSNVVVRVTVKGHAKVQLWEGGPYWATTNVGAENPEDYGLYFWWGDTVGYRREGESWVASNRPGSGFSFWNGNVPTCDKGIATLQSEKWITADGVLAPDHDAAHVHWGGKWRMPTKQESDDLSSKCNWNETTRNGVKGWTVTGKGAYGSASIFLPCAGCGNGTSLNFAGTRGYYRLSVPNPDDSAGAWSLGFDSDGPYLYFSSWRHIGQSVRPVQGFTDALMAAAGVAHAGDSAKMVLDLRTGPRASGGDETLAFSSLWDGGADATVTIAQDGVAIAENLAGEGERAWSVPYNGTYELTHVTYTNGVAGKVETATFVVTGKAEPPEITNVVATPSEPWDGTVSISFNVVNSPAAACPDWNMPFLSIVATDNVTGSNYVSSAAALSARAPYQLDDALAGSSGTHEVTWDFKAQGIDFVSTNVTFTVAYLRMPDWCVIDLSGGKDAAHYPVTYVSNVPKVSNVPNVPGVTFNADAYKTTNLVMRLVGPGSFTNEVSSEVEVTNAFYCAVFETTQRQWELVKGNRPSYFNNEAYYATRPVEQVSWNMICSDSDNFLKVLRSKTGLASLDLPTEAQWEYACRAGTTNAFNNGKNMTDRYSCTNLNEVGRYWYNGGSPDPDHCEYPAQGCETDLGTAAVGSYDPNKWGLYDMHGNVWEWCLERYSSSGSSRVLRGGGWYSDAHFCRSSIRDSSNPSNVYNDSGFRLVRTLSNNFESERSVEAAAGAERAGTVCSGTSEPIRIGGKDFAAGDIALTAYEGEYDAEGHTIGISTNAIEGLVLRYAVAGRDALVASGFPAAAASAALPLFTNVCDIAIYVEVSAPGYFTFTTNVTVKITQASLTITAKDQTYRHNGTTQGEGDTVYDDPDVIAGKVEVDGLKGADMLASIILDGQGTDAGGSPIEPSTASIVNGDGDTVTGNYNISYVNGTMTILGAAEVSGVQAASSDPWDGKVQIAFNVTNSPAAACPDWNMPYLSIVATDNETGSNYVADVSALSGDTDTADGAHMVTWDMDGQGIKFYSTNVTFTVAYLSRQLNDYCVIDLSCGEQGTGDARCPVSYLDAPPEGGWTDAYRTTNLVLRLVRPGTFTMGSPDPEDADQGMGAHEVTISSPFYIGVFETTQWQWRQVTGSNPSQAPGDTHPVEGVSYNMARGASWPSSPNPSSDSFLGMLRSMTGIDFDLPLEEQWEYACRAGTTTKYNSGDDDEASMNNLGRYEDNCNDGKGGGETHAAVGSYAPNAWGIYDMHGNVCEWCLDWYDPNLTRVRRGGSWLYGASGCTSYFRMRSFPTSKSPDYGFRLCCSVGGENGAGEPFVVCSGASEPTTAGKKPAAELAAELKWKHLKATGTYFAQLKLTCTNWLDSGISDLKFMFADRVGADGKTSAALWSTPLRSANTNVEESDGTTYRFVALDESLIEEENTPVVYGVADLSAAAIPVAERTIEMYVRTGVAPEGQNAASAQVDDFVGYVCWTSSDEACAVPVVASGAQSSPKFGAVRPLAGASLPSPKTLNESLALGVPVVEGASPYCRVAEFSVDGERIKGRIEVGAGENVGALGANATVTVLGAASPAGPFEELGAVEVAEDGSFSLAVAEGAQFFKLRIDVKEVVR